MLVAFMACGAATLGAVLSGRQWLAMTLLAAAGFSLTTAFSTLNSLVQEHAPNELRGRVLSIFGLAFRGGGPVGSLAAGALMKAFGAPTVLAGFASLLFLIAAAIRLRNLRLRGL
jgi:MFS family permease